MLISFVKKFFSYFLCAVLVILLRPSFAQTPSTEQPTNEELKKDLNNAQNLSILRIRTLERAETIFNEEHELYLKEKNLPADSIPLDLFLILRRHINEMPDEEFAGLMKLSDQEINMFAKNVIKVYFDNYLIQRGKQGSEEKIVKNFQLAPESVNKIEKIRSNPDAASKKVISNFDELKVKPLQSQLQNSEDLAAVESKTDPIDWIKDNIVYILGALAVIVLVLKNKS